MHRDDKHPDFPVVQAREEEDVVRVPAKPVDEDDLGVKPHSISLVFTGGDDGNLRETVESVIGFAEESGLFLFHASLDEMDATEVPEGSPLHQFVTGQIPRA